jgi:hypothetical protein
MKVSGVGQTSSSAGTKRSARAEGKGDFGRQLQQVMEGAESPTVHAAAPLGPTDALLAAQSVGDATEREGRRRRTIARGESILERLEALRRSLLLGAVPRETLAQLTQLLRTQREQQLDPRLAALMDEIELRAEVELAKLERDRRSIPQD